MKKLLPTIVFSALILSQVLVNSFRINIWPLTSYEMFANKKSIQSIGAFRLKALNVDGSTIYINLHGSKVNWKVYNQGIATNNSEALRNQMLRDLKYFESNNKGTTSNRFSKLTLVSTESADNNDSNKIDLIDKEILTINL